MERSLFDKATVCDDAREHVLKHAWKLARKVASRRATTIVADAEDIAQHALIIFNANLDKGLEFDHWVSSVHYAVREASGKAVEKATAAKRDEGRTVRGKSVSALAVASTTEAAVAASDMVAVIREKLGSLASTWDDMLNGLTAKDVAARDSVSYKTAWKRFDKCKKKAQEVGMAAA